MKTHEFRLVVKTDYTRKMALFKVLAAFARRMPDDCEFHLKNRKPTANTGASITRASFIRKINKLRKAWKGSATACAVLSQMEGFIRTQTKRTAARKGGLGRK